MADKVYTGKVVSNKMEKTVVVAVTRQYQHPMYKKTVKKVTKFKAHDAGNACQIGDDVKIIETRPVSKDKRWLVLDIMNKPQRSSEK
ncbi:MAG: 30S ribosomal protein S17 [Nitrospiraceae bacterium]|nr:30S ribosomal protein S17 [Nitrospiraceae bacterium]